MASSAVKPKTASDALVDQLATAIDEHYEKMSIEEINSSQEKLRAIRERLIASRAQRRETA